jgi:hypothetical protein
VCTIDDFPSLQCFYTGQCDCQRYIEAETLAVVTRTNTDSGRNGRFFRQFDLLLRGYILDRPQKAGRITGCEKLLRICTLGAIAAKFLRS